MRNVIRTVILALVLLSPACGDGGTGPGGPNQVTLTASFFFQPSDITIDPGTTVTWVSSTSTLHTITPSNSSQPGVWNRVEVAQSGTVLTHTFNVPGQVYNYFCEPHQATGMTGVIRVRD